MAQQKKLRFKEEKRNSFMRKPLMIGISVIRSHFKMETPFVSE